ncbi:MAG: hypothetical protein ABIL39_05765 [candidate division WOR-3 bacterium]
MKRLLPMLAMLLVYCGGPQKPTPSSVQSKPEIALEILTENEIQRFLKVLPTFVEIVNKEGKESLLNVSPDDAFTTLQEVGTLNRQMAALEAKLREAGMGWNEFWPTYAKTMLAYAAIIYDSMKAELQKSETEIKTQIAEIERMLKDPNVPEAQKEIFRQSLEAYKKNKEIHAEVDTFYAKVPTANKQIVRKYFLTLTNILKQD